MAARDSIATISTMETNVKLCGFRISNYHNKVRLVLLEKGIAHEEDDACKPSQEEAFLERSVLGKVPFLEVDGAVLTESDVICEYLEDAHPQRPLLPKDPLARAKVRELNRCIELHVELVARRLYKEAFFGGKVSDETKREVERTLEKGVRALARLARFEPFVAGSMLTLADCAAFVHLPIVSMASKSIYGRDVLEPIAPLKDYLKRLGERECFARVNRDRREATAAMQR
ncbi:MAG: glutathione S-transferase [Burkholderiaceae bacterium]|jgi:glutathione S-transferase|nr:glutathione S-transferase [Burkholderiaceae bacterium]